jgi:hypothetical protein
MTRVDRQAPEGLNPLEVINVTVAFVIVACVLLLALAFLLSYLERRRDDRPDDAQPRRQPREPADPRKR